MLGLPGSFGRYVEYFRQRGQFHVVSCAARAPSALVMSVVAATAMIVERHWFSQLIFGTPTTAYLVVWLALCLAVVILHNYLTALFIAVRRYRVVTILQFVQSLGFAIGQPGAVGRLAQRRRQRDHRLRRGHGPFGLRLDRLAPRADRRTSGRRIEAIGHGALLGQARFRLPSGCGSRTCWPICSK